MSEPALGAVELFGQNIYQLAHGDRQRLRARIGFVHGHGGLLFNRTVQENIALPVSVHAGLSAIDEQAVVERILRSFALDPVANLLPHEMDGSTRWRVCLARALVLNPKLLTADEPTSSLDPSVQGKVLKLLLNLQIEKGLTMLFVSQDIGLVRKISDRIGVMLQGRIVERGPASSLISP